MQLGTVLNQVPRGRLGRSEWIPTYSALHVLREFFKHGTAINRFRPDQRLAVYAARLSSVGQSGTRRTVLSDAQLVRRTNMVDCCVTSWTPRPPSDITTDCHAGR
jgi:hypothetical protein